MQQYINLLQYATETYWYKPKSSSPLHQSSPVILYNQNRIQEWELPAENTWWKL